MLNAWINTPFLTHNFRISDRSMIDRLRSDPIDYLYIDTERGLDVSKAAEAAEPPVKAERRGAASIGGQFHGG